MARQWSLGVGGRAFADTELNFNRRTRTRFRWTGEPGPKGHFPRSDHLLRRDEINGSGDLPWCVMCST